MVVAAVVVLLLGLADTAVTSLKATAAAQRASIPAVKKRRVPSVARDGEATRVPLDRRVQPSRAQRHEGGYCEIPSSVSESVGTKRPRSASNAPESRLHRRAKEGTDADYVQTDD